MVEKEEALRLAQAAGLDLVEVSPKSDPPVCKILDFGQLIYQQRKERQKARQSQKAGEIKGVRLSYGMGAHDISVRIKQTEKFLEKGYKVKIEMILRGRQKAHPDHVQEVFDEFIKNLSQGYAVEQPLKRMGHKMMVVLTSSQK